MTRTIGVKAGDVGSGGDFLTEPGSYHLIVEDVKDGELPNGDAFHGMAVITRVAAGDLADKKFNLVLYDGDESHKDRGAFAFRKQAAFLIAANVLSPAELSGDEVGYDEQQAIGSDIIVTLELGKPNRDGKQFLDVRFADIFHVDDPRVAKISGLAISDEQLKAIPDGRRHKPEYFEPLFGKKRSSPPPATTEDDLDVDL